MKRSTFDRVREIALALPEVSERSSHGEPYFFVRDRHPLCYFHDNHDDDGRTSLWCPAPPGGQAELVSVNPERYFRPQPSANGVFAGWVGVFLDRPPMRAADWREIAEVIEDAYRCVAPKSLVRTIGRSGTSAGTPEA